MTKETPNRPRRTWHRLVRGIVVVAAVVLGLGLWWLSAWMDPEGVRRLALEALRESLAQGEVEVGEARWHWLGGVRLKQVRLLDRQPAQPQVLFSVQEAVLYPDREQLARGRMVVHRIELYQPALNLVVREDGTTNLHGLIRPGQQRRPLPLLTLHGGGCTIVDQARQARWELQQVQGTLTPTGQTGYQLRLSGAGVLGPWTIQGVVDTDSGAFDASCRLQDIPLSLPVLDLVRRYLPQAEATTVAGSLSVQGELGYHPRGGQPWSWDLRVSLREGRWEHPAWPWPLEQLQVQARLQGWQATLEQAEARCGQTLLALSGQGELSYRPNYRLRGRVQRLPLDAALIARLPPRLAESIEEFHPQGMLDLAFDISQRDDRRQISLHLEPRGMSACYEDFPYRVDEIVGELRYTDAGPVPLLRLRLEGRADGQPVRLVGDVYGEGLRPGTSLRPGFSLEIFGDRVPITDRLIRALDPYPKTARTVAEFQPRGYVSVLANLHRLPAENPEEKPPLDKRFKLRFHDASMRYEEFPYPVEEIEGTLEIAADESWRFYDFRGQHKGGEFQGAGLGQPGPEGVRARVWIHGHNALLDEEMEAALDEEMKAAWKLFQPAGRVDFLAQVDIVGPGRPLLDLRAVARRCRMKPSCFPYQLDDVEGDFHYAEDKVVLTGFRARHGQTQISLKLAEVTLYCNGGYRADLYQLRADHLWVDQDFLEAVPPVVRKAFATLQPDRPIRIVTDLVLIETEAVRQYHWDGSAAFARTSFQCGLEASEATGLVALRGWYDGKKLLAQGNLRLSEVTVARLPLRDLHSRIRITEDAAVLEGIQAHLYGGQVYGPLRVQFAEQPQYQVDLTVSRVDLETFARGTLGRSGQVRGKASGRLRLEGRGADLQSLRGQGSIHVENGAHIYDLPLILNLLTALSGQLPKGSAFQEARADLEIVGERMHVRYVELLGDALSLRGQGTLRVDGSDLNLEMYGLLWGRSLPLLPPLIDRVPVEVSRQLMKIRLVGSLGDVQVKREPVPILTEPARELWQRLRQWLQEGPQRPSRP
jgi:hypothetical protein